MTLDVLELADEYVVGLLDPAEEAEVEARLADDTELAAAVDAARTRFLELDLTAAPAAPAPAIWSRIEAQIEGRIGERASPVAPLRPPVRTAPTPRRAPPWRRAAMAAMAASVVLAAGLGWQLSQPRPVMIAVLIDAGGEPRALVEAYADDTARVTPLGDLDIPAGRTMQLWTKLPDEGAVPISLGLLTEVEARRLAGPDLPAPRPGQLYEITFEQEGGSPTGGPTGEILGKGFARMPR